MKEQHLKELKIDSEFTKANFYGLIVLTAVSASANIASLPLSILNVMPQWADLAMSTGGAIVSTTSIVEIPKVGKALKKGREYIKQLESAFND